MCGIRPFAGLASLVFATGCTTLGPMPAITATNPLPAPRPGVEGQLAAVPGYFLSSSVQESPQGSTFGQASLMFEPGEWIGVPGLALGGRYVGDTKQGGYPEPMLRYRAYLDHDERLAASVVAYGTHASGSASGASYEATRGGAEAVIDLRTTPPSNWVELHFVGGGALTALGASGSYCLDANRRYGVDCDTNRTNLTDAKASGVYPAAVGALALDFGRHLDGVLHGSRIAAHGTIARMPRVEGGTQVAGRSYAGAGISITLAIGASK